MWAPFLPRLTASHIQQTKAHGQVTHIEGLRDNGGGGQGQQTRGQQTEGADEEGHGDKEEE